MRADERGAQRPVGRVEQTRGGFERLAHHQAPHHRRAALVGQAGAQEPYENRPLRRVVPRGKEAANDLFTHAAGGQ